MSRRPPGPAVRTRRGPGANSNPDSARGQAHTLEGVVASLVILSAIVFALEMTAVTPLSASTSSQHLENQQEATAKGILTAAAEEGALKRALLFWKNASVQFHNSTQFGYYASGPPPHRLGRMLNRSFDSRGIAYNVYLSYRTPDGESDETQLIYQGRPSDNAVSASRTVALFDNDPIFDHEMNPTGTNVSETSEFYAPDASDSSVYNVVRVEVVVWRI